MALNIYLLHQGKATKLWSRVNNQGSEWLPAAIDIDVSGPYQVGPRHDSNGTVNIVLLIQK